MRPPIRCTWTATVEGIMGKIGQARNQLDQTNRVGRCEKNRKSENKEDMHSHFRDTTLGAGRHPRTGAVTDEQQRPKPKATQPSGRQSFLPQASLLAPLQTHCWVCSSLRALAFYAKNAFAANVIVFMPPTTKSRIMSASDYSPLNQCWPYLFMIHCWAAVWPNADSRSR